MHQHGTKHFFSLNSLQGVSKYYSLLLHCESSLSYCKTGCNLAGEWLYAQEAAVLLLCSAKEKINTGHEIFLNDLFHTLILLRFEPIICTTASSLDIFPNFSRLIGNNPVL